MATRKNTFLDKFMLLVAIAFAIGLAIGIFAGNLDPREHPVFAFFGLGYLYILLVNLAFVLWWLIRRKYIYGLVTILIIFSGYRSLKATISLFGKEGGTERVDNSIRLMTYNVHNFQPFDEKKTDSIKEQMFKVIKDQDPDVVCFQEFYTRFRGKFDILDSLKKQLNIEHVYFVESLKNDYEANGLAIFSKYPIVAKGEIPFKNVVGNMSIYVDLDVNGKQLRVYNVHFQSISFQPQDYDYIDQVKGMKTKVTPSKRILRMLKRAFEKRSDQVDIMKAEMSKCKIPYLIAGDFNDTPASYVVTQVTKDLNNAFIKQGNGFGKTYNGKFPNFQIDYIATSKDIDVLNYHITEAMLSDHFPVRSDLLLK